MLHQGILPFAEAWDGWLANLKWLVIDEVHTYRGVFGCHVAQVLRRLLRLAGRRGARPRSSSARPPSPIPASWPGPSPAGSIRPRAWWTSAPPRPPAVISPSWTPTWRPARWRPVSSPGGQAGAGHHLLHQEPPAHRADPRLGHPPASGLQKRVAGYRAGFLPAERRQIEGDLAAGRLAGVVTTSALEMGIDIGGLDVCLLVGYPGSQIATWQRGGRVGRAGRESAVVMVAAPDALDQYFVQHPAEFFARPLEAAVLDPDNRVVVGAHLPCAAAEEALVPGAEPFDLARHRATVDELVAAGELLWDAEGKKLFAARKRPQRFVDLRGAGESFAIVGPGGRVIGSLDGIRAFKEGHPARSTCTRPRARGAGVGPQGAAHPGPAGRGGLLHPHPQREGDRDSQGDRPPAGFNFLLRQGELKVTETIGGYERRHIKSGDLLGVFPLELPPLVFVTHGLWLEIEPAVRRVVEAAGFHFMGAIHALEHAAIAMFPLFALCDRSDIGGISIPLHPQVGKAAVFIYDGVPGGAGLAERAYEVMEDLLARVEELLAGCPCEEGCPACIHSPKCGSGNKPLDKAGALLLTRALLGKVELGEAPAEAAPLAPDVAPPPPRPAGEELRFGVFDLETQRLAAEVGGWQNAHLMRMSVGVLYEAEADRYESFPEAGAGKLIERLGGLQMVVGFNIRRFDYAVLSAYTPRDLTRLPTLDLLDDLKERLGFRLSLQSLGEATLGAGKSADGLLAVKWWREGALEKLAAYCRDDVALTLKLFRHGQEKGYLLYRRKDGELLRVPVDWSWPSLRPRFA